MPVLLFMLGYGLVTIPSVLYSGSIAVMQFFDVPSLSGLDYFPSLVATVIVIGLLGDGDFGAVAWSVDAWLRQNCGIRELRQWLSRPCTGGSHQRIGVRASRYKPSGDGHQILGSRIQIGGSLRHSG